MKTIQMTIDAHLLKAVDRLTRARKTTRSALIRTALEAELRRARVNELEARHAAGYLGQPTSPGEFDAWLDQQEWGRL
jgi:metal-responsive CopG/Arc/MetJ family transcriptional regulator